MYLKLHLIQPLMVKKMLHAWILQLICHWWCTTRARSNLISTQIKSLLKNPQVIKNNSGALLCLRQVSKPFSRLKILHLTRILCQTLCIFKKMREKWINLTQFLAISTKKELMILVRFRKVRLESVLEGDPLKMKMTNISRCHNLITKSSSTSNPSVLI